MNHTYPNTPRVYKKRARPVNMRVHGHTTVYYPHTRNAHSLATAVVLYLRGRSFFISINPPQLLLI